MAIRLGDKVKDMITGFSGIAVSRTVYLNGCVRICVASEKLGTDGKTIEEFFDEQQLIEKSTAKVGGSGRVPPTRDHPRR